MHRFGHSHLSAFAYRSPALSSRFLHELNKNSLEILQGESHFSETSTRESYSIKLQGRMAPRRGRGLKGRMGGP